MRLILLTHTFPYAPPSEQFLMEEIPFLQRRFDKVTILVSSHTGICAKSSQPLRGAVEIVKVKRYNKALESFFAFCRGDLFHKAFLQDISTVVALRNRAAMKATLVYHIGGRLLSRELVRLCRKSAAAGEDKIVLYSYWLDDKAYAVTLAKKKLAKQGIAVSAVSRAHGPYDIWSYELMGGFKPCKESLGAGLDAIYPISEEGKKALQSYGFPENRMHVYRLGTQDPFPGQQSIPQPPRRDRWLIVSCSNLVPVKRLDRLVAGLAGITELSIEWVHFGEGAERKNIEKAMKSLPPSIHGTLRGKTANSDIRDFYKENLPDLILNTSAAEGIPVSLMEAASVGIPIIATDVGGNSEICLDGVNGFLLPAKAGPQDISTVICRFFAQTEDQRLQMRENSRKLYLEKFSAQKNHTDFANALYAL